MGECDTYVRYNGWDHRPLLESFPVKTLEPSVIEQKSDSQKMHVVEIEEKREGES